MHVCMYVCMYVWVYVCMHVCMYVCMYTFIYMYIYMCTDILIDAFTYVDDTNQSTHMYKTAFLKGIGPMPCIASMISVHVGWHW